MTLEQRSERDQGGGCSGQRPWRAQRSWGWFFTCLMVHQPIPVPMVPQSLMPTSAVASFGYLGSWAQLASVLSTCSYLIKMENLLPRAHQSHSCAQQPRVASGCCMNSSGSYVATIAEVPLFSAGPVATRVCDLVFNRVLAVCDSSSRWLGNLRISNEVSEAKGIRRKEPGGRGRKGGTVAC